MGLVSRLHSSSSSSSNSNNTNNNNNSHNTNNPASSEVNTLYLPNDKQDLLAQGLKLASVIASKSPVAVQGTKELLNVGRDRSVDDSEFLFLFYFYFFLRLFLAARPLFRTKSCLLAC